MTTKNSLHLQFMH